MTSGRHSKRMAVAVRAYRSLCRAYPPAFRDRFSHELEDDFRRNCRDALAEEGSVGLYKVWLDAILDLAVNVPAAHLGEGDDSRQSEQARAAAYVLMVGVLPSLVLVRLLSDSAPTAVQMNRLAGLTVHCSLVCATSMIVRRSLGLTLPIACVALASLVTASLRVPSSWVAMIHTPMSTVVDALRISVPVALVLLLVNVAPLITQRQRVVSSAPSAR